MHPDLIQLTREYKTSREAQADIRRWTACGWRVVNTTGLEQRAGFGRFMLLGVLAFALKPKAHVLVVYEGTGPAPTQLQLARADITNALAQNRATWTSIRNAISAIAHVWRHP